MDRQLGACRKTSGLRLGVGLLSCLILGAMILLVGAAAQPVTAQGQSPRPTPTTVPQVSGAGLDSQAVGYANLVVTGITVSPSVALVGQPVSIQVTVANIGTANPVDSRGMPANFFLDLFVSPPVATAEDLLSMPGYPPTQSAGMQSFWLPAGGSHTVVFSHTFTDSGMHSLYAVVDTAELGLPYGNVNEGGAAGELDNAAGPTMAEARFPNVLIAKDVTDFSRGPGSSLALVRDPSAPSAGTGTSATTGNAYLTLGYFEEPPGVWGLTDPLTPDYDLHTLDRRLSGAGQDGPQEWPRLAAKGSLVVGVWQDRRNSQLTNYDIYLSWSGDEGATWLNAPVRVNDDAVNAGDQRRPAVAISPTEDRVLVVWHDNRVDAANPGGKYRIMGQWYALAGGSLSPDGGNLLISSAGDVNSLNVDVAAGPEGNFYVVWQDDRAGNTDIWLRAHSAAGWMSQPTKISDTVGRTNQRNPKVAAGRTEVLLDWTTLACPDNVPIFQVEYVEKAPIVVVWEDDRANDWDIYLSYSIDQARTFAVDHRVNDDPYQNGAAQRQPAVGVAQMWEERELEDKDNVCAIAGSTAKVTIPAAAFYTVWQDMRAKEGQDPAGVKPSIYLSRIAGTAGNSLTLDLQGGENERVSKEENSIVWQEYPTVSCSTYAGSLFDDGRARHNAFIAWSEWGGEGESSSDIYLAIRGDAGAGLSTLWTGGVIPVNSGAHATNLEGSAYLSYPAGDPPPAYQVRPSLASNISMTLPYPELGVWRHTGHLYAAWDDNRLGGYERDVYLARSNLTYLAGYGFYPDPARSDQLPVGQVCRHASGSYISPIYDMGPAGVVWDRIEWFGVTPSGTYVTLQTRVGDDPEAMEQWMPKAFPYRSVGVPELGSPLQGYDTPGQMIVDADGNQRPRSRYIQYRVNMWAWPVSGPLGVACGQVGGEIAVYDRTLSTPVLYSVSLHHEGGPRQVLLPLIAR